MRRPGKSVSAGRNHSGVVRRNCRAQGSNETASAKTEPDGQTDGPGWPARRKGSWQTPRLRAAGEPSAGPRPPLPRHAAEAARVTARKGASASPLTRSTRCRHLVRMPSLPGNPVCSRRCHHSVPRSQTALTITGKALAEKTSSRSRYGQQEFL